MRKLTLLSMLLPSLALAQVAGICSAGKSCSVYTLKTSGVGVNSMCWNAASGLYSFAYGSSAGLSQATLRVYSGTGCNGAAIQTPMSYTIVSGVWDFTTTLRVLDGSFGTPAYSFTNDIDTGLYSAGANQLGVATAGARSFVYSATPGYLEGATALARLKLDGSVGACIDYNSTASVCVANNQAAIAAGTSGLSLTAGGVPTSWAANAVGHVMQIDSNSGRMYWQDGTSAGNTPWRDLGSGAQPVLQQMTYVIDVDSANAAASKFIGASPSYNNAVVTVTTVDAAAAGFGTLGTGGGITSPYIWHFRTLNTTAVANSTSTMTTSAAFVDSSFTDAPRFCQRVSLGATQTSRRVWVGLMSALPGSSDAPGGSYLAFRFSTNASDTKWMYCVADNIGASQSCTTTNVTPTSNGPDLLCVDRREGSAATFWVNGVAIARVTSGLPASGSAALKPVNHSEALTTSARAFFQGRLTIEVN